MPDIQISTKGIECLLKKLNPHKASGPDQLKPIVLQTLHKALTPILQVIFKRSIDQGKLPGIWKDANVTPIFKKGDITDPANYRPFHSHVFYVFTCVKVLEHILASNMSRHFTDQNILYDLQHGFRERRSCETQLIMPIDELSKKYSIKKTD